MFDVLSYGPFQALAADARSTESAELAVFGRTGVVAVQVRRNEVLQKVKFNDHGLVLLGCLSLGYLVEIGLFLFFFGADPIEVAGPMTLDESFGMLPLMNVAQKPAPVEADVLGSQQQSHLSQSRAQVISLGLKQMTKPALGRVLGVGLVGPLFKGPPYTEIARSAVESEEAADKLRVPFEKRRKRVSSDESE
jgi:hypothetical protein